MKMRTGERYHCTNRFCGCEIEVTKASLTGELNPRCCCGEEMKKPYIKPAVQSRPSLATAPTKAKSGSE